MTAREELEAALVAITVSARVLKPHADLMQRFLRECRHMDNFGHIVDPTLWKDSERRAVSSFVEPFFRGALDFLKVEEEQTAAALAALTKVKESP